MTNLMDFTSSLTRLPESNATIDRWLYGTKELERKIFERTVSLCRYFDRIPEQTLSDYADALVEALASQELGSGYLRTEHLDSSISSLVEHLKSLEDPVKTQKANQILEQVRTKFQIEE